ncbi:MAG: hypothetical protein KDI63_16645 [Gammaproteobacteria bacterium]|nr:hypothetical protein [Gammaproteobacteria bacterium]
MAKDSTLIVVVPTGEASRKRGAWAAFIFRVLFVFLLLFADAGFGADPTPTMRTLLQEDRHHFLETYADWLNNSGSQNAAWLRHFLTDLENGAPSSSADWLLALRRLVSLSSHDYQLGSVSGYIEDNRIIPILVASLTDENQAIREYALQVLGEGTRRSDLLGWKEQIRVAIGSRDDEQALRLLGQLPLMDERRLEILSATGVPLEVRARLGDHEAEQRLISEFVAETDYSAKRNLAQQLGYAGTEASVQALLDGLDSPVKIEAEYDDRSIRCDVLLALGRIYQDEPLFTRDARLLTSSDEETFDRLRGTASYIADVEEWAQKNFARSIWGKNEVWFVRWRHIPVIIPPNLAK